MQSEAQNEDDRSLHQAVVWALIGAISLPGLIYPLGALSFGFFFFSWENPLSSVICVIWVILIASSVLKELSTILNEERSWQIEKSVIAVHYRTIFLLGTASFLTEPLNQLINSYFQYERSYDAPLVGSSYWDFLVSSLTVENLKTIVIQIIFILLSFPLIRAYFRFLGSWISSVKFFVLRKNIANNRITTESAAGNLEIEESLIPSKRLIARYMQNIESCNSRAFVSIICMAIFLIVGVISFIIVFQGSPTSRALQLASQLETSPALYVSNLSSKVREVEKFLAERLDGVQQLHSSSFSDLDAYAAEISTRHGDLISAMRSVNIYFNDLAIDEQKTVSANDVILKLREIKREIENASDTNWDLIVVRTAILLLSYFALRIFFRIFENAISERRHWEEKVSAVILIGSPNFKIGEYLALTGKLDEKDFAEFMDGELEKLLQQLRDIKKQ